MVSVGTDSGSKLRHSGDCPLESRKENQLEHGSGLGLWAVYWGVTQIGGRLSISDNDPRGSVVTVTVPAKQATRPPVAP